VETVAASYLELIGKSWKNIRPHLPFVPIRTLKTGCIASAPRLHAVWCVVRYGIELHRFGPLPLRSVRMELAIQIQVEELPEGVFLATSDERPGLVAQTAFRKI